MPAPRDASGEPWFDDVPDAVIVTDDAGEVLAANAVARARRLPHAEDLGAT